MYRKALHIVLALFLVVVTSGTSFSMHYCGGKLESVSVNKEADSCCSEMCGCCENKDIHLNLKEDYTTPVFVEAQSPIILNLNFFAIIQTILFPVWEKDDSDWCVVPDPVPPPPVSTRLAIIQSFLC